MCHSYIGYHFHPCWLCVCGVILRLGSLHRSCFLRGVLRDETEKAARETIDRVPQFIVSAKIQVLKPHKNKSSVKTEPPPPPQQLNES